jgi:hypothetical protein
MAKTWTTPILHDRIVLIHEMRNACRISRRSLQLRYYKFNSEVPRRETRGIQLEKLVHRDSSELHAAGGGGSR